MTDAARATLRNLLVNNCVSLGQRLTRGLGSSHSSNMAGQDSASRHDFDVGTPASPDGVLRFAVGIAADQRRAGARKLAPDEIEALLRDTDSSPEADLSLHELQLALSELPGFTRAVFEAVLAEGVSRVDVAKRFGVGVPTIDAEIQKALEHGLQLLPQKNDTPKGG